MNPEELKKQYMNGFEYDEKWREGKFLTSFDKEVQETEKQLNYLSSFAFAVWVMGIIIGLVLCITHWYNNLPSH